MKPYPQSRRRANLSASSQPQHVHTSGRASASSLLLLALFLALTSTALASSTWYVDGVNGSDNNDCKSRQHACKTIGHGISLASPGDSIMVAAATYTENLTIAFSLKLIGADAKTTIIDGGGKNTVVTIPNTNSQVSLSKLTIRNGSAPLGGGINNYGALRVSNSIIRGNQAGKPGRGKPGYGGGIYNAGTLTINLSTLTQNTATGYYCVVHCVGAGGGGIDNESALSVNNSTISGNSAQSIYSSGGGIFNIGTALINNSTFSGNSAGVIGGGIESPSGSALTISNSTLSGNIAGAGGAISSYLSPVVLQNTIVANNTGGNCNGTMTSSGYNLSSDNTCNFNGTGDLNNTDPKLGQLGNYGGPTQTIPLLFGSPAIDARNPGGCTDGQGHLLKTDQRGKPRHDKEDIGGCDMGAYERQTD
jgi:hypothetical protein